MKKILPAVSTLILMIATAHAQPPPHPQMAPPPPPQEVIPAIPATHPNWAWRLLSLASRAVCLGPRLLSCASAHWISLVSRPLAPDSPWMGMG